MSVPVISRSETRYHGFTVIELLVVMSIIILLIALLMPTFDRARMLQRRLVCLTHQNQLAVGLFAYAADHRAVYPSVTDVGRGQFGDAYDYVRSWPYSGKTYRPWYGFGLLIKTGIIPADSIGEVGACPSFDNAEHPTFSNHCSDRESKSGFGVSHIPNQMDETEDRYRIISSYNYRGTSYFHQRRSSMRASGPGINERFIMVADTADLRFRGEKSRYNEHGGYNRMFGDGSGAFWDDPEFLVDELISNPTNSRSTIDGRGILGFWASNPRSGGLDEAVYTLMAREARIDVMDLDRLY